MFKRRILPDVANMGKYAIVGARKEKKRGRGGGERGGRGKGRIILGELCRSSALSKNVSEPRKMARPAEHPAGRSRYPSLCVQSGMLSTGYCKHCLILLAAKPGGVHLMHITQFTTIHYK